MKTVRRLPLDFRVIDPQYFTENSREALFSKYLDEHDYVPETALITDYQQKMLRTPTFEPMTTWRGIPLEVK
jgi:hypothetical protein